MSQNMLETLFNPKGVAVIGASGKELHIGNRVIKKHTHTVTARSRQVAWERSYRLAATLQRRKGKPYTVATVGFKPVDL